MMKFKKNDIVEISAEAINPFRERPEQPLVKIIKSLGSANNIEVFLVKKLYGFFETQQMSEQCFKKIVA